MNRKHKPKGQQPVNPNYKHKNNWPIYQQEIKQSRAFRLKRWRGQTGYKSDEIKTVEKFWDMINLNAGRTDYYYAVLTQAERNLAKLFPGMGSFSLFGARSFVPNKYVSEKYNDTIILRKLSKKKRFYFNEQEWKEMIDLIADVRHHNKSKFNDIIFCAHFLNDEEWEEKSAALLKMKEDQQIDDEYMRKRFPNGFTKEEAQRLFYPKLYEKEKQFIINAGCEFIEDVVFDFTINYEMGTKLTDTLHIKGWRFRIPDIKKKSSWLDKIRKKK